jgi:D-glycero-alpha-D-manno-heptose 1-phosphate guanylyltransferase
VLEDVTALILAGGKGTRLQSVVADRNKVLADVNGRPFLTYLFDQALAAGIRRAILCTGYKAEQIRQELGSSYRALQITYSPEDQPLGTAGALAKAARGCAASELICMNGDSYCDVRLDHLWQWHQAKGGAATLQLAEVHDLSRYGSVTLDGESRIIRFDEKGGASCAGLINAGIYCMGREVLESIPANRAVSMEREVFPSLLSVGLFGRRDGGRFLDIGTPASYMAAAAFFGGTGAGEADG